MPNEDGALQPHELAERGLIPAPALDPTKEVHIMAFERTPRPGPGVYVPEEDVTETLPDGRTVQVAVKGAEMPMAEAVRLGLVKAPAPAGPSETKEAAPAETKEEEAPAKTKAEAKK